MFLWLKLFDYCYRQYLHLRIPFMRNLPKTVLQMAWEWICFCSPMPILTLQRLDQWLLLQADRSTDIPTSRYSILKVKERLFWCQDSCWQIREVLNRNTPSDLPGCKELKCEGSVLRHFVITTHFVITYVFCNTVFEVLEWLAHFVIGITAFCNKGDRRIL